MSSQCLLRQNQDDADKTVCWQVQSCKGPAPGAWSGMRKKRPQHGWCELGPPFHRMRWGHITPGRGLPSDPSNIGSEQTGTFAKF